MVDPKRRDKIGKPAKATESPISERTSERVSADSSSTDDAPRRRFPIQGNVAWALITGLAVGFAVGREAHRFGLADTRPTSDSSAPTPAFIAAESGGKKVYGSTAEFPAAWVKDTDLANKATLFAGLTDAQKTTVMQALNERDCTCGCGFGSLATCLHKDPNCPNAPAIAKMVVDLAKQGKTLDELFTAIEARQKSGNKPAAAPEAPKTPQYIEVAAYNPRKGPKEAKVTIVEFSDFQ